MNSTFEQEVKRGKRFQFGKNWRGFLSILNEERIIEAEKSLKQKLEVEDLKAKTFLDIGSGSGLFSLAARRLGATVHSFDYDPDSVACTEELKRRYFEDDPKWTIEQGSVLDEDYLKSLGQFDIVYSWGVLQHTGSMWQALANINILIAQGSTLFISIYNAQGGKSKRWRWVKAFYCYNIFGKAIVASMFIPYFILGGFTVDILKLKNPLLRYYHDRNNRGMSRVHDWFDWLGGYPFEVAKPEEIFQFYKTKGYVLEQLKTCGGGLGCNEYVFTKS